MWRSLLAWSILIGPPFWVYYDSKQRGMGAVVYTAFALFLPIIGLIFYLYKRREHPILETDLGSPPRPKPYARTLTFLSQRGGTLTGILRRIMRRITGLFDKMAGHKTMANTTKWLGSICFIIFIGLLISAVTLPESMTYWCPGASEYYSFLDDNNAALDNREIGIGDNVEVTFSSKAKIISHDQVKSVSGYYALLGTKFTPSDGDLEQWMGEEKPRDWDDTISGDMKPFAIEIIIPVPENPYLEGRTIEGKLKADVIYPVETTGGDFLFGRFENDFGYINEDVSIHIFSGEELTELSTLKRNMLRAERNIFYALMLVVAGLWVATCLFEGSWEFLENVATIIGSLLFLLLLLAFYWSVLS